MNGCFVFSLTRLLIVFSIVISVYMDNDNVDDWYIVYIDWAGQSVLYHTQCNSDTGSTLSAMDTT